MVLPPSSSEPQPEDLNLPLLPPSSQEAIVLDDNSPAPAERHVDGPEMSHPGLGRHLGLFSTTLLIAGRIIGTGIFSTPGAITKGAGSVGAALLLWTLGLSIAFSGLMVWLELGCMIPRSGGEKVYLEAAYQRPKLLATTVFAFQAILLGFSANGCIIFAQYVLIAAGHTATEWQKRGIAIAVISFVTVLHTVFPKWGVRGMNIVSLIKIGTLLFIVVAGWVVLGGGVSRVLDPHASFREPFGNTSESGHQWAIALFKVLNSYQGWSNAAYVVDEIKHPVRTLKIAGPLGLSICGACFIFANISYFAAATPEEVSQSGQTVASLFMKKVFGATAEKVLSVLIAMSAFGNVMTVTFAQSRVNQELAKEGIIPASRFWASSWPFGSPSSGLLLHWIPSFVVIVAIPFGDAYNFILDLEGYPLSIINFFVVVGLFWLRHSRPKIRRPFRCWLPIAAFYLCAQVFLIVAPFLRPPNGKGDTSLPYWLFAVVGIMILLAGVVYWAFRYKIMPAIGTYRLGLARSVFSDNNTAVRYQSLRSSHEEERSNLE
ncbi:High-affinity methionine permease [Fulvia fulva]|uniref:High-affinity methionine permease n=1 Tax=Passalora fulva TaxID=5499 RepID=A0A9Q8LD22_PASFU|nr:High-affinity methionine permease [Fulvia fulva]KAK4629931.1 High-affinity methionine permease [Fulvia fulva]UJO15139.1 High-affinity methionine permease [Fulvia fulva]WPV12033.1 High-affinity methionine permease [Fulvia fulva]